MRAAGSRLGIPADALVLIVGPAGAGKSTFAAATFKPTQVVSSDACRLLVSDDENDQSATSQAFALVHAIARARLARGLLTVIDATNLRRSDRRAFQRVATRFGRTAVAILFDVPLETCLAGNRSRRSRQVSDEAVVAQHQLLPSATDLLEEGFDSVLTSAAIRL